MSEKEILEEIKEGISNSLNNIEKEYKYIKIKKSIKSIEELFEEKISIKNGYKLTDLFQAIQGVTCGGEGSSDIFSNIDQNLLQEKDLIFKTLGGRNINKNKITWSNEFILFPYVVKEDKFLPAFYDEQTNKDILDYDINIYSEEIGKDITHKLNIRIAKGEIKYPLVAEYLTKYHDTLYYREFEGKNISEYNKSWYEYHRPRTPSLLTTPKIVLRRLMQKPSFAIDTIGYLPKDSVISLLPNKLLETIKDDLEKEIKKEITLENCLNYVLSFLNSDLFIKLLDEKQAKKQGDYPIVSEGMLKKVVIPFPNSLSQKEILEKIRS